MDAREHLNKKLWHENVVISVQNCIIYVIAGVAKIGGELHHLRKSSIRLLDGDSGKFTSEPLFTNL
jgi:hypothetical protein